MGCWHHTGHAMMQQEMMIIIIITIIAITINIIVNIIFTINTIIANAIIICDFGDSNQLCSNNNIIQLSNIKATLELTK